MGTQRFLGGCSGPTRSSAGKCITWRLRTTLRGTAERTDSVASPLGATAFQNTGRRRNALLTLVVVVAAFVGGSLLLSLSRTALTGAGGRACVPQCAPQPERKRMFEKSSRAFRGESRTGPALHSPVTFIDCAAFSWAGWWLCAPVFPSVSLMALLRV